MDIGKILAEMQDCPCGRAHKLDDIRVEIGEGLLAQTPEILKNFPRKLLVVADKNTLAAGAGILELLGAAGYDCKLKLYDDLRVADMPRVNELVCLSRGVGALLSVGSGSLSDICRLASFRAGKPFAIFATAPSMDGFAANSAPITENNFKKSHLCHAPRIIIGDAGILAAAPQELKSAGFGDMAAKYIALADWQIARLAVGEYFCPKIAGITKKALDRVVALADDIGRGARAAALMEGLVLSGLAMSLASATRPASGAEHVLAHFWEIKKLEQGLLSDFHGRKVGVAALLIARLYHEIVQKTPVFQADATDWDAVYAAYGPNFRREIQKCNSPPITSSIRPEALAEIWPEVRRVIQDGLPSPEALLALMKKAGAPTAIREIRISPELAAAGLKYHPYMRDRVNLTRLVPMLGL